MAPSTDSSGDGPPRSLLIAAIGLAVAAIVAVLAIAVLRQPPPQQQTVPIATVPAPKATSPECNALMAGLPEQLGDYRRAPAADPAPPGAAAWRAEAESEPVILRCGLDRPAEFVVGAPIQVVDPVQWFELTDADRSTWFAVDRPVYIALTLPSGSGPTPIQEISEAVAKAMPANPVDPARAG
ncbi:DUF3515 domain-containing protein [Mycolicibacterium stellerae]|uniref:DUF3515 domain-containing protein n=1 Tax=Mycolicibacterium stellerae TaxID=2358193 RepID=UPI000F0B75F1|nr:DUF3515 domain-containing protein [Mycolicibacterium stellerae]